MIALTISQFLCTSFFLKPPEVSYRCGGMRYAVCICICIWYGLWFDPHPSHEGGGRGYMVGEDIPDAATKVVGTAGGPRGRPQSRAQPSAAAASSSKPSPRRHPRTRPPPPPRPPPPEHVVTVPLPRPRSRTQPSDLHPLVGPPIALSFTSRHISPAALPFGKAAYPCVHPLVLRTKQAFPTS